MWLFHIYECNPKKPINTAYHLCRAALEDGFPDDPQTCVDYGFERALLPENRSMLLGLYRGMIMTDEFEPKSLHRWRVNGTLIEEIKKWYEKIPESHRGGYYLWFLQNQWVLDSNLSPPHDLLHPMLMRGWCYTGGSPSATKEEIHAIRATWPQEKQQCFLLCSGLLSSGHPGPDEDNWLHFGFCVCKDEYSEGPLSLMYRALVAKCTFDEIYTAYDSSSLIALFDAKGFKHEREQILHLDDVLAGTPRVNKSVWNLKQYVIAENRPLRPSVGADYGFFHCRGEEEVLELKEVYKQLFLRHGVDPIKLHEAAIRGKLFQYVEQFGKLKKKFSRIMKNSYPLNCD
jgi:hypothetical protein